MITQITYVFRKWQLALIKKWVTTNVLLEILFLVVISTFIQTHTLWSTPTNFDILLACSTRLTLRATKMMRSTDARHGAMGLRRDDDSGVNWKPERTPWANVKPIPPVGGLFYFKSWGLGNSLFRLPEGFCQFDPLYLDLERSSIVTFCPPHTHSNAFHGIPRYK